MKPQSTHVAAQPQRSGGERFTLPATARGRELAEQLVSAALACDRIAYIRAETIELESECVNVPVLVVELGKRPMEGVVAKQMKANQAREMETVKSGMGWIPKLSPRELEYVRSAEANWLKMSTKVL